MRKYIPPHLRNQASAANDSEASLFQARLSVGSADSPSPRISRGSRHSEEERGWSLVEDSKQTLVRGKKYKQSPFSRESQDSMDMLGYSVQSLDLHSYSIEDILQFECPSRCKEWMSTGQVVCSHHRYYRYPGTLTLAKYFQSQSPSFMRWLRAKKQPGEGNIHINKCFQRKSRPDTGKRHDSSKAGVVPLFNRFLKYAADIDFGTGYVEEAYHGIQNDCYSFLDLGFAPGGMVSLLLDRDPRINGVGVNLEPSMGGNVYPEHLDCFEEEGFVRFQALNYDIIELSRMEKNVVLETKVPLIDNKFDLCIVGITTSGSKQQTESSMDEHALKNLLHFAQLLTAFRNLREGGAILIRMHLSLRLVDIHILAFLLENFKGTPRVTKPLTEFAMRKTYWLWVDGFVPNPEAFDRLKELVKETKTPPYEDADPSNTDGKLNNPILISLSIDEIIQKYGSQIASLLTPMWETQADILEQIMIGKSDRLCNRCRAGDQKSCIRCEKNVPLPILEAVNNVKSRLEATNKDLLL